jgi:DNA-binding CsgD family transcriptional regulator
VSFVSRVTAAELSPLLASDLVALFAGGRCDIEPEVVGREEELAVLAGLVERPDGLPRGILLEGEAGIGKTTLWRRAIATAAPHYRVLAARPSEPEAQISFAGMADLLDGVLEQTLEELPDPQRRALEVALLLADPQGARPEQSTIAFAFLGCLRVLAQEGPVLVAVDDVQWLDGPSKAVLEFAARRIAEDPVGLLVAARRDEGSDVPLGLDRALGEERVERLRIGPLSLGAVQQLIRARLGAGLPRPMLRRVHETSAGNPFFAVELARALGQVEGRIEPSQPLPVPETIQQLLEERVSALPQSTENALRLAALLTEPTVELLTAAGSDEESLRSAVAAHVIDLAGGRIRFVHPLLAAGIRSRISEGRRRDLHRRLTGVVEAPEERARHMALGAEGADADVAREIEQAASVARARGAPGAAAELLEEAVRLTVPADDEGRVRRSIAASDAHRDAGDWARGRELAEQAVERARTGPERAAALLQLAACSDEPVGLCEQALAQAGDDHALRARIGVVLCDERFLLDVRTALEDARTAVAEAEVADDPALLAQALSMLGFIEAVRLEDEARIHLERAARLETELGGLPVYFSAQGNLGLVSIWPDRLDEAREHVTRVLRRAIEHGDEHGRIFGLLHLVAIELRAGNWQLAAGYAREGYDLWERAGDTQGKGTLLWAEAVVDAHLGRHGEARSAAEEALSLEIDDLFGARNHAVLGLIAFSEGDYEAALAHYSPLPELLDGAGVAEPAFVLYEPELVESLIAVGRLDEARARVESMGRLGRELDRPRLLATAARCRGILAATEGDMAVSLDAFEQALAEHDRLPVPFERARTMLAHGSALRRAKQRRAARESLGGALELFERLGALVWAERARSELARVPGRRSGQELTVAEQRIARLVAEGKTNKEVAAELFVAVHTVEAALTRVYGKLGIRSRTELARRLPAEHAPVS